jgi:hypothetical protein
VVAPFPTLDPVCTPVELSNYPPSLTEEDVWGLFSDFHIAQFQLPNHHRWTKPLRLRVDVSGAGEAERAVKELDGFVLEGRRITVKLVDGKKYEEQEVVSDEMADEVKVQIFSEFALFKFIIDGVPCLGDAHSDGHHQTRTHSD